MTFEQLIELFIDYLVQTVLSAGKKKIMSIMGVDVPTQPTQNQGSTPS